MLVSIVEDFKIAFMVYIEVSDQIFFKITKSISLSESLLCCNSCKVQNNFHNPGIKCANIFSNVSAFPLVAFLYTKDYHICVSDLLTALFGQM